MNVPTDEAETARGGEAPVPTPPAPPAPHTAPAADANGKPLEREDVKLDVAAAAKPQLERQQVVLRQEARVLTLSVLILNVLFVVLAIVLVATQESAYVTLRDLRPLYRGQLALASICLGVLGVLCWMLAASVRASVRERRVWSSRQIYFAVTGALLLVAVTLYSVFYITGLAVTLAQPDCSYDWVVLAAMEFMRRFFFSIAIIFLLVRLNNMKRWRGQGALDADPDQLLVVDRPWQERGRANVFIFAVWLLLVAFIAMNLAGRLKQYNAGARAGFQGCDADLSQQPCPVTPLQATGAILAFVANLVVAVWYLLVARRALIDHKALPFCRYRATHIFVRVQARVLAPVQVAVLLSVLMMETAPSLRGNCMSAVSSQIGTMSVELSLTLAAAVLSLLYMPKAKEMDSPLLQSQTMGAAAEQLAREPLLCVETALRLYYWSRLAYRNEEALDDPFVNGAAALALFDLEHWEKVEDEDTDTHAVIGWSSSQAVLAFRGTSSMENTMTDLKSWRVKYTLEPVWRGRKVGVHAGFLNAWLDGGFNNKVLDRLAAIDAARAGQQPLRIWVTGHSLGGALAVLASQQISRAHPASHITLYTFGCPRVGNSAFADMFNDAIPDAWALINRGDPVTIIPKASSGFCLLGQGETGPGLGWCGRIGFKRIGQRVNLDHDGNLIVRATYFELSVVHRGTSVKAHMMGQYSLSLAAFLKAQFSPSKAMRGGEAGVEALAAALDLGAALVALNLGLDALRDPAKLPLLADKAAAALESSPSKAVQRKDSSTAPAPAAADTANGALAAATPAEQDACEDRSNQETDQADEQGCRVWLEGSHRMEGGREGEGGEGVRTLVLTNVSAEEAGAGSGTPNEVWATFPDNLPGASKTPVWFLPAVQRLVAQLDPQQPYLLTDCYWDKFKQGQIGVCALNEPRCIPCHVNTEGKNLTALRVVKTCGTPCTRELMCEAFKAEYGKAMGRDCRRPPINFVHGGAGQILSIGLLRRLKLREFEKCVRSRAYKTCHSSDCIFTRCMWAQGWGYTDPGFTVEHPGTIRTLFDPWRGLSMTQQLREVSLGQTAGACGVECQAGLPHMVSNHLVLRAATQPHEAALLMRELVDAYEFWDAVRTGRTLSRRRRWRLH
eukprot:scaffold13.g326.t1